MTIEMTQIMAITLVAPCLLAYATRTDIGSSRLFDKLTSDGVTMRDSGQCRRCRTGQNLQRGRTPSANAGRSACNERTQRALASRNSP
jgi:hypothetical protein